MARKKQSKGFTLIELVVAISLIGIALLGVTYSLQFSVKYSADPLWQTKTLSLAKAYSEEILAQRFDETSFDETSFDETSATAIAKPCSPCTPANQFGPDQEQRGEGINQFDDVDDYHGLSENTLNVLGEPRLGYDNYKVSIQVAYAGEDLGLKANQAKRITLAITPPGQKAQEFIFYRGNF